MGRAAKKLTADSVQDIRRRVKAGEAVELVADDFGVSAATVYQILRGETWRHVTGPETTAVALDCPPRERRIGADARSAIGPVEGAATAARATSWVG
jgi:hypothetical protein